ncbi:tRNA (adenosine(37)-N6)-threonylcarbamoyltransferase complex ATPase subunit type 1 TsaE [Xanthomonas sp. 60]
MREFYLPDPASTDLLGEALADTRPPRALMALQGDLGAGKSTTARALLRALGVTGAIRSPTYTLVERYPLGDGGEAWHLDLYRIGGAAELDFLGLDDDAATLWLVEWPERGEGALPPTDLVLELAIHGQGRKARLIPVSDEGEGWVKRAAAAEQLRGFSVDRQ